MRTGTTCADWGTTHACHGRSAYSFAVPIGTVLLGAGKGTRTTRRKRARWSVQVLDVQHINRAACTARYETTCTLRRGMPYATLAMKHGANGVQHPARDAALERDAHTMRACGL